MRLTVHERLKLLELLPLESSYSGIKEFHRLTLALSLNDDEVKQIQGKNLDDGRIQWDQEKALGLIVDIAMGEWVTNEIRLVLREKDREGVLSIAEMSLFEKFIMDYE